jgi:hypothetical protein
MFFFVTFFWMEREEPGGRDKAIVYLMKELGTTFKEIEQYLVQ